MGGVKVNVATVPRRTGDGRPVRRPVATPASGVGGSGLYYGHNPSYRRYEGSVLVGAILVGFREPAFFVAGFWESVFLGPASRSRPSRIFLGGGFWGWVAFWESALGVAGRGKAALGFVCVKA